METLGDGKSIAGITLSNMQVMKKINIFTLKLFNVV